MNKKILLLEDDMALNETIADYLESLNYSISSVFDGNSAMDAIFITSLNSIVDLENGFESGCDDYIRKPFALKELKLRIETILKREFFHQNNSKTQIDTNIFYDTTNDLLVVDSVDIQLNNKDAKLLKLFYKIQSKFCLMKLYTLHCGIMMNRLVRQYYEHI